MSNVKENEQLTRIENLLAGDISAMITRLTNLEVSTGIIRRQQDINTEEISSLRKQSSIWSGINSSLIAISTTFMLILKGK